MKRKRFVKTCVSIVLVMVAVLSSIVPAHATGAAIAGALMENILGNMITKCLTPDGIDSDEASYEEALQYLNKIWLRSLDSRKEVDYNTLSSVYAQLLMQGVPCEIRSSRGAAQGYYIRGTGDMPVFNGKGRYGIKDKYFSDGSGNVFYAKLPDNGRAPDTSTTVPSTTAPSVKEDTSTTYVPSTPSDYSYYTPSNEFQALQYINTRVTSIANELHRVIDRLAAIQHHTFRLYMNMGRVIDSLNNVTSGLYKQVDLLSAYLPRLDDVYNRLFSIQSATWASVDMESSILLGVTNIGARLDSVISNGAVQVNTSSIDARLDKLISMYSKVNSVVLDTAAVNGGQIKSAVGGELKDVVFWGSARRQNPHLLTMPLNYTLSDAPVTLGAPELRSIPLGASIPAYISADPVLAAGVWKSGSTYYLSDTYNAVTGEYVQRIKSIVFDGSENWVRSIRANDASLFSVSCIPDNTLSMPMWSSRYGFKTYTSAFDLADDSTKTVTSGYFSHYGKYIRFQDRSTSLDGWKKWLSIKYKAGEPLEVWYALAGESVTTYLDLRPTIAIPEGDSTSSAEMLRITAKYETYDSYTQTADIINAINNIPPYDDSGLIAAITNMSRPTVTTDLTEITTRLDDILGELRSTSGSATCEHSYAQDMEQDATCTLPGLMISTCAKCGDSYSEIVDPLGHDWVVSSHVDAVTDPDTGEETASAYDVYTCSRCDRTYEDHTGDGAPDEDYSNTSISKLVVKVFSKLGTFAGKLIGFFVHLLDKALTSVDNVISKFNDYTAQIGGFGGAYPSWLTGFWAIIPMELQTALTFAVICMALGAVGRKLFFS